MQIKGHFYCTLIHPQLLLLQNISAELVMSAAALAIELNLDDAYRQNNEHSVLLPIVRFKARRHKVSVCIELQNQGSHLELQDIWPGLFLDQN